LKVRCMCGATMWSDDIPEAGDYGLAE
jgi:hypothetical protein